MPVDDAAKLRMVADEKLELRARHRPREQFPNGAAVSQCERKCGRLREDAHLDLVGLDGDRFGAVQNEAHAVVDAVDAGCHGTAAKTLRTVPPGIENGSSMLFVWRISTARDASP